MSVNKTTAVVVAGLCIGALGHAVARAEDSTPTADVIAVGPLELIEPQAVTVLGRAFKVEDTSGLTVGSKVAIHGTMQPDGSAVNAWAEQIGDYAAGSDQVYETGTVSKVDPELGRLTIGGSDVDYTNSLSNPSSVLPTVGEVVSVSGIQPTVGGVILSDSTEAGNEQLRAAYFGSMRVAAGIQGGHVSAAAVTGGNVVKSAVTGGNLNSAAVTGGNIAKTAVTGGNINAAAVTGGNVVKAAVTGGNLDTAAVTGGNIDVAAVTGGNVTAAAVTGGNVYSAAVTGGNVHAAAVTGGNVYAAAVTGGNAP